VRDRSFIAVVSVLAVLFLGAGGLYVYDLTRDDLIAEGVRVANVDVGGLRADEARGRLASALQSRLREPVTVRAEGKTYKLFPRAARATFDVNAMVDSAVARSREGNLFTRVVREVRGEPVNADLDPRITYSPRAVSAFLIRVRNGVNRKPRDASLDFSGASLDQVPGHEGRRVNMRRLRGDIEAALAARVPSMDVRPAVRRLKPKVTKAELAAKYPYVITVDRPNFKLRYFKKLKLVKTYTIAIGQVGFDTPTGLYQVQNKAIEPAWSVPNKPWAGELAGQVIPGGTAQNPLKARWMGIYDGAGIHGTDQTGSLGSVASHGCIRMAIPDVIELYDQVPVATPVYIA